MLTDQDVEKRQALVRKLQSWGDGAIMGVKKIAADTQKEILDGMLARIEDVQVTTKRNPVTPRNNQSNRVRHERS